VIYRTRERQMGYGRPIGILALEENIPCPPGTPGNPTTFSHPVIYEVVKGVDISSLANLNEPDSAGPFLEAAQVLADKGVSAIAGNCGLMIVHQAALRQAVAVPVLMSSLLLLPLIAGLIGPDAKVGVIASSTKGLKNGHLALAGAAETPIKLATMDGRPYFRAAIGSQTGELDFEKVEAEVVDVARGLVAGNPDIRAILLECVDMPPYAHAVQEAVDLPVFDITTLIGFAASGIVRRPFTGIY
jgi:Asp/Glu/hydantoin racemase